MVGKQFERQNPAFGVEQLGFFKIFQLSGRYCSCHVYTNDVFHAAQPRQQN
jgi:hypothetical protein